MEKEFKPFIRFIPVLTDIISSSYGVGIEDEDIDISDDEPLDETEDSD